MLIKQLLEVCDIPDTNSASGRTVEAYSRGIRKGAGIHVYPLVEPKGGTDMVKVRIHGSKGETSGGDAPTLGLLGYLGGLGAGPGRIEFVSGGDGALVALSLAAELLNMQNKGDILKGDTIVSTHVCPDAPTRPHKPVAFMDSPVEMAQVDKEELSDELDAVLSVDTTKGNRIINTRGFVISPMARGEYIPKVSESVLDIMQTTTGWLPYVYALSIQDITPYGNDLYHLNSILQPATGTKAPVIGVTITTKVPMTGCTTGATYITDCEEAARFMLEVAETYMRGECSLCDEDEFTRIRKLYGSMSHLRTLGKDA